MIDPDRVFYKAVARGAEFRRAIYVATLPLFAVIAAIVGFVAGMLGEEPGHTQDTRE